MKKEISLFITLVLLGSLFSCDSTSTVQSIPTPIISANPLPSHESIVEPMPTPSVTAVKTTFTIETVPAMINQRCTYCHSAKPNTNSGFSKAPSGIILDTEKQMIANINKIKQAVLTNKSMPMLPLKLSDTERSLLGQWCDSQGKSVTVPAVVKVSPTVVLPETKFDLNNVSLLITQKCAYCHSTKPNSNSGYSIAPKGITFDSEKEIQNNLAKIKQTVIIDKIMPIGSIKLSDTERSLIGQWIEKQTPATQASAQPVLQIKTAPEIITQKCSYCHSVTPDASSGFKSPPMGITFNSESEMIANITKISQVAIIDKSMPIGNITLTNEERASIKQWIDTQNSGTDLTVLKPRTATDIITQKCAYCHATKPDASSGYTTAPKKFIVDTVTLMSKNHDDINKMVKNKEMPPTGKITMTDAERALVTQWCDEQEKIEEQSSIFGWLF